MTARHWRGRVTTGTTTLLLALVAALAVPATASTEALAPVKVYVPRGSPGPHCNRVLPLRRAVATPAVLSGAMRALLGGPTLSERRAGYGGWFTHRTAGFVRSVELSRGTAHVDFRDFSHIISNASSSCGSALLLAQLDRTARQFPAVLRTRYSFNGSTRAFYDWLQLAPPPLEHS